MEVNSALERKTVALEEILATYQAESARRTVRIVERIDQFVRPLLEKVPGTQRDELLTQLDAAFADATSESLDRMSQKLAALSPAGAAHLRDDPPGDGHQRDRRRHRHFR